MNMPGSDDVGALARFGQLELQPMGAPNLTGLAEIRVARKQLRLGLRRAEGRKKRRPEN